MSRTLYSYQELDLITKRFREGEPGTPNAARASGCLFWGHKHNSDGRPSYNLSREPEFQEWERSRRRRIGRPLSRQAYWQAQKVLGGTLPNANWRSLARYVYRESEGGLLAGPLISGYHIHHVCEDKRCINPAHLVQLSPAAHLEAHQLIKKFGPWSDTVYGHYCWEFEMNENRALEITEEKKQLEAEKEVREAHARTRLVQELAEKDRLEQIAYQATRWYRFKQYFKEMAANWNNC